MVTASENACFVMKGNFTHIVVLWKCVSAQQKHVLDNKYYQLHQLNMGKIEWRANNSYSFFVHDKVWFVFSCASLFNWLNACDSLYFIRLHIKLACIFIFALSWLVFFFWFRGNFIKTMMKLAWIERIQYLLDFVALYSYTPRLLILTLNLVLLSARINWKDLCDTNSECPFDR